MAPSFSAGVRVSVCLGLLTFAGGAVAGEPRQGGVGNVAAVTGALLQRTADGWKALDKGGDMVAGASLVALPKAEIRSAGGAVQLLLLADVGQRGPYPILETGVILREAKGAELDVDFRRGLIVLVNTKEEGAARVRLKVRGEAWELTLLEPGSKFGLELYSRHAPGVPTVLEGKLEPPVSSVVGLAVKGKAALQIGTQEIALQAPPGSAMLRWDSLTKTPEVTFLKKLPEELTTPKKDEAKLIALIDKSAARLHKEPVDKALAAMVKSNDKADRLVGITLAGGVDDLHNVLAGLADEKHADSRAHAVIVLRHWLGRGAGQPARLLKALAKERVPPAEAKTLVQLLFSFDEKQKSNPLAYQLLIGLLEHPSLPVRELASWHLVRIAPAGKDIRFDAAAPAEERARAVEQWRKIIPPGKLPGAPAKAEKE